MPSEQLSLVDEDQVGDTPDSVSRSAFDSWNEYAQKNGWPKAQHNTAGRPAKLRRAVKDVGGLHSWRALLEKCGRSEFLCGKTQSSGRKPFVLTLDWIVKPANLLKCLEGNYWRDEQAAAVPLSRQMDPTDEWGRRLRDYKPRGFWVSHWGKRPEEHGCQAPQAMLEAWRERLGIVVQPYRPETREERLSAMIVSYRKVGRFEDANRIERQLAEIEGRPPVEVPAPDARDPDVVPPKVYQRQDPPRRPSRADVVSDRINRRVTDVPPEDYTEIPESDPDLYGD